MNVAGRQLAVVTGAASGIGFELAGFFAEERFDPIVALLPGRLQRLAGKAKVVAGSLTNKVQAAAASFIPDSKKAEMHRKMAEPGSDE